MCTVIPDRKTLNTPPVTNSTFVQRSMMFDKKFIIKSSIKTNKITSCTTGGKHAMHLKFSHFFCDFFVFINASCLVRSFLLFPDQPRKMLSIKYHCGSQPPENTHTLVLGNNMTRNQVIRPLQKYRGYSNNFPRFGENCGKLEYIEDDCRGLKGI